jgi:dihydroneopterin aldolase
MRLLPLCSEALHVGSVIVQVEKPEAPVPFIFEGVAVEIRRSRDGCSHTKS